MDEEQKQQKEDEEKEEQEEKEEELMGKEGIEEGIGRERVGVVTGGKG